jgi:glycosyltransferase involved in cell wall biosynthesis
MNIAFDISPLEMSSGHRLRGTGFYTLHLKEALAEYFPENNYIFFSGEEKISENIDIIHYPYFEPFSFPRSLRKKCKTVITVHDLTPLVFPEAFPIGVRGFIAWNMQKLALKKADAIITDSQCSKNDIIKLTGIKESKTHVIYLSSGRKFVRLTRGKLNEEKIQRKYLLPKKFALYVGDVTWNKNLPRLIQAIKKTEIPLVMVGKSIVEKNYDKNNAWNNDRRIVQALMSNDNQIIPLGYVPEDDLVCLYNIATVFVMPSLYEGFGLPILEAMHCGCPVITTDRGSLPEIIDNAAYIVNGERIENIADGIKKVFENHKIQEDLSERGLRRANEFSWRKTAEQTIGVYSKVLC